MIIFTKASVTWLAGAFFVGKWRWRDVSGIGWVSESCEEQYKKILLDGDDYFEFQCDDEVMHRRGGTYKFHALDVDTFSRETCQWISQGKEIADCCKTTEELHEWYLKPWT